MNASQGAPRAGKERSHYFAAVLCALVLVLIVTGYVVYNTHFKKTPVAASPAFDLSSLFFARGPMPPDPANPCLVLEQQLETTRTGDYQMAYDMLSSGLKKEVGFEQFVKNAKDNGLLLRQASTYIFPSFSAQKSAAAVSGFVEYRTGGRSKVEASFAREGGAWRIARLTMSYE